MSDCEKYQELISCLIDGELEEQQAAQLEQHIAHCPECMAMYRDFSAVAGMVSSTMEPLPDSLHEKIMDGVKAASRPGKKPIPFPVRLRPYISAAACLVVVIGAVFALRGGPAKMADSAVNGSPEAFLAADTADSMPAEAPAASGGDSYFSYEDSPASDAGTRAEPSAEADMSEDVPCDDAVADEPAQTPSEGYGSCNSIVIPDLSSLHIDSATLTLIISESSSESRSIAATEELSAALKPVEKLKPLDIAPSAVLELVCGETLCRLTLYFDAQELIISDGSEYWLASAAVDEFLAIE